LNPPERRNRSHSVSTQSNLPPFSILQPKSNQQLSRVSIHRRNSLTPETTLTSKDNSILSSVLTKANNDISMPASNPLGSMEKSKLLPDLNFNKSEGYALQTRSRRDSISKSSALPLAIDGIQIEKNQGNERGESGTVNDLHNLSHHLSIPAKRESISQSRRGSVSEGILKLENKLSLAEDNSTKSAAINQETDNSVLIRRVSYSIGFYYFAFFKKK